jgi:hypothetical protein
MLLEENDDEDFRHVCARVEHDGNQSIRNHEERFSVRDSGERAGWN